MNQPDYAKVFVSILDSTIANNYRVRHLFEDLLKLADWRGEVNATPESIARRTGWPFSLQDLRDDLAVLEAPDPQSQSPEEDGRRIVLISPETRDWGWRVVNIDHYRKQGDIEQVREQNRVRQANRRARLREDDPEPEEQPAVAATKPDFSPTLRVVEKLEQSVLKDTPPPQLVHAWVERYGEELILETLDDAEASCAGKGFSYFAEVLRSRHEDPSQRPGARRQKQAKKPAERKVQQIGESREPIPLPETPQGWTNGLPDDQRPWENVLEALGGLLDPSEILELSDLARYDGEESGRMVLRIATTYHEDRVRETYGPAILKACRALGLQQPSTKVYRVTLRNVV